jgi:hypothetical protein
VVVDWVKRARFWAGNVSRLLSSPWLLETISPEVATNIFGCSFGDRGWHHLRRTFEEYDKNPDQSLEETSLWKYLREFTPNSISTIAQINSGNPLPLFVYPWVDLHRLKKTTKHPLQSRFCGPSNHEFIEKEYHSSIDLYKNLNHNGYKPYHFPNSFISGTWLIAENGEKRFVVMQGNHRMAALAHLRYSEIKVRANREIVPFVFEKDRSKWPQVTNGMCSEEHALAVFQFFFKHDGWHVANKITGVSKSHRSQNGVATA